MKLEFGDLDLVKPFLKDAKICMTKQINFQAGECFGFSEAIF